MNLERLPIRLGGHCVVASVWVRGRFAHAARLSRHAADRHVILKALGDRRARNLEVDRGRKVGVIGRSDERFSDVDGVCTGAEIKPARHGLIIVGRISRVQDSHQCVAPTTIGMLLDVG